MNSAEVIAWKIMRLSKKVYQCMQVYSNYY